MAKNSELKKMAIRTKFRNIFVSTYWRTFLLSWNKKLNALVFETASKQQQHRSLKIVVWLASSLPFALDGFILKIFCRILPVELRILSQRPILFSDPCSIAELLFLLFSSLVFENWTDMTAIKMLRNQKDPILKYLLKVISS